MIQQSIKEKLKKNKDIQIPYLKYISKLKLYIFYILSFIDCLNKNNLEVMYDSIFSNLDIYYHDDFKEIFSYILDIKTNWFNMFNIEFINKKDENEANQILRNQAKLINSRVTNLKNINLNNLLDLNYIGDLGNEKNSEI